MRGLFKIGCLLWLVLLLSCQEDTIDPTSFGAIAGEVFVDGNVDPIENARVTTSPVTSTQFTDNLGRFSIENIETGTYSVRVEKDGFVTSLETINVFADNTTNVSVQLQPDTVTNTAPNPPFEPTPTDGAIDLPTTQRLSWRATDPDADDELQFDVRLFTNDFQIDEWVATGITDTFVELSNLRYAETYFWQVVAQDKKGVSVNGPVWRFQIEAAPDFRYWYTQRQNDNYVIIAADGLGATFQLTDATNSSWRPRMSPRRDQIAFIRTVGLEPQLFLMDRHGDNIRQVSDVSIAGFNQVDLDFAWSPDASQLLYMNNGRLYLMNADGSGLRKLADAPAGFTFTECDWTEQGNRIAVRVTGANIYNSSIYLLDGDGQFIEEVVSDIRGTTGGPMFSTDGSQLLYTHDVSGFESITQRQLDSRIFLKDINTRVTIDLSIEKPAGTNDLDARFSPDGAKIIFVNTNNDGISPKSIYVMDLDGDNRTLLFSEAEMPEWK